MFFGYFVYCHIISKKVMNNKITFKNHVYNFSIAIFSADCLIKYQDIGWDYDEQIFCSI